MTTHIMVGYVDLLVMLVMVTVTVYARTTSYTDDQLYSMQHTVQCIQFSVHSAVHSIQFHMEVMSCQCTQWFSE